MTACNGASVNRAARCGERKTFELSKSGQETKVLNPQNLVPLLIFRSRFKLFTDSNITHCKYIFFALIGIWNLLYCLFQWRLKTKTHLINYPTDN